MVFALQRAVDSASPLLLEHLIPLSQPNLGMSFKDSRGNIAGCGAQCLSWGCSADMLCRRCPSSPLPCASAEGSPGDKRCHGGSCLQSALTVGHLPPSLRLLTRRPGELQGADSTLQSTGGWLLCSHPLLMIFSHSMSGRGPAEGQLQRMCLSPGASALLKMLFGSSPTEDQAQAGSAETPTTGQLFASLLGCASLAIFKETWQSLFQSIAFYFFFLSGSFY